MKPSDTKIFDLLKNDALSACAYWNGIAEVDFDVCVALYADWIDEWFDGTDGYDPNEDSLTEFIEFKAGEGYADLPLKVSEWERVVALVLCLMRNNKPAIVELAQLLSAKEERDDLHLLLAKIEI